MDTKIQVQGFSLADTLDCGQTFRWKQTGSHTFCGIQRGKYLKVSQEGETLIFHGISKDEADRVWTDYFDLRTDYAAMQEIFRKDPVLQKAAACCGGIRLLCQDPWEALCSFIISQNNNIPRIKAIVERLCQQFGEECPGGYAFPKPEKLAVCTVEELAPLRAGFRAKYILDAAQKVAGGEVSLERISNLPLDEARTELMRIKGVGIKVAECALLYGFHRLDAFPVDTWIRKALEEYYPNGFPDFAQPRGVAQQYLFHYIRHRKEYEKNDSISI
ncbi:MAG: DNA-3-methyladenine glycosylase family protein [Candidatus Merdivicinus sp.]|jgi:N-glycosylase/DNA lyase